MLKKSQPILYKRVNRIFNYKVVATKKISLLCAYLICFFCAASSAYAFNRISFSTPTQHKTLFMINKARKTYEF